MAGGKPSTIVDATVDMVANTIYQTSQETHGMQNGNLSTMLKWMVVGLLILLVTAVVFAQADAIAAYILTIVPGLGA